VVARQHLGQAKPVKLHHAEKVTVGGRVIWQQHLWRGAKTFAQLGWSMLVVWNVMVMATLSEQSMHSHTMQYNKYNL